MDSTKEFARRHAKKEALEDFGRRIDQFRAPFKTGDITLNITESYNGPRTVVVGIQNWNTFVFPVEPGEPFGFDSVVDQLREIWRESRIEPESHIILGRE